MPVYVMSTLLVRMQAYCQDKVSNIKTGCHCGVKNIIAEKPFREDERYDNN